LKNILFLISVLVLSNKVLAAPDATGEASRFGLNHIYFYNSTYNNYSTWSNIGIKWTRPHPGPAVWLKIEHSSTSGYNWSATDALYKMAQDNGMHILATIFPYNPWDQQACGVTPGSYTHFATRLGLYRNEPCDITAATDWTTELIERYDYDGDSSGKDWADAQYAIKYW